MHARNLCDIRAIQAINDVSSSIYPGNDLSDIRTRAESLLKMRTDVIAEIYRNSSCTYRRNRPVCARVCVCVYTCIHVRIPLPVRLPHRRELLSFMKDNHTFSGSNARCCYRRNNRLFRYASTPRKQSRLVRNPQSSSAIRANFLAKVRTLRYDDDDEGRHEGVPECVTLSPWTNVSIRGSSAADESRLSSLCEGWLARRGVYGIADLSENIEFPRQRQRRRWWRQ